MKTIKLKVEKMNTAVIPIGMTGENLRTQVRIDCGSVFSEYPTAVPILAVRPPNGDAFPFDVTTDGSEVVWNVTDSCLTKVGTGEIQLTFTVDSVKAKSYVAKTRVSRSIYPTSSVPDPISGWMEEANEILDAIPGDIQTAMSEYTSTGSTDTIKYRTVGAVHELHAVPHFVDSGGQMAWEYPTVSDLDSFLTAKSISRHDILYTPFVIENGTTGKCYTAFIQFSWGSYEFAYMNGTTKTVLNSSDYANYYAYFNMMWIG